MGQAWASNNLIIRFNPYIWHIYVEIVSNFHKQLATTFDKNLVYNGLPVAVSLFVCTFIVKGNVTAIAYAVGYVILITTDISGSCSVSTAYDWFSNSSLTSNCNYNMQVILLCCLKKESITYLIHRHRNGGAGWTTAPSPQYFAMY